MGDAADDAERRAWDERDNPMPDDEDFDDEPVEDFSGLEDASVSGAFSLRIDLGNDAMVDAQDIALALDAVSCDLKLDDSLRTGVIMDVNGNSCGSWAIFKETS